MISTVKDVLKLETMYVAYGCTETSPVATMTDTSELDKLPYSVGKVIDHAEIKLVDNRGKLCCILLIA